MVCPTSFQDKIIEIPGIAMDNFEGDNLHARAFFLSHYHGDHINGLSEKDLITSLAERNTYLYTSEITAEIIEFKNGFPLRSYVKPLGRDSELITLPSVPDKGWDELIVEVTLIPAGHSFGSTMFLFKTAETTVLYTGDFRIRPNDIPKYRRLHTAAGEPIGISTMYVDTTFIGSEHEEFAKRSDTADSAIDQIDKWLAVDSGNAVSLYTYANYTIEFIINRIHERLRTRVYVGDDEWKFYSKLRNHVPGMTNDETETRIHMCRRKRGGDHRSCIEGYHRRYLHVHLTAWMWRHYELDVSPVDHDTEKLNACFATHCSRSEIIAFVEYFKPSRVVGFPNTYDNGGTTSGGREEYILSPKLKIPALRRYKTARVNNVVKKIF